jgi:hypothetical protein
MQITALTIISVSELAVVNPDITYDWIEKNNHAFLDMLHELGMNTKQPIEKQENVLHKNRFDKIVQCDRYVGSERWDIDWVQSGYASQAAIDKSKGNTMLTDLYRLRGLVD